jgi:hypothetical protein
VKQVLRFAQDDKAFELAKVLKLGMTSTLHYGTTVLFEFGIWKEQEALVWLR